MAEMFKDQEDKLLESPLGPDVHTHLAQALNRYLVEDFENAKFEELIAKYPGVGNVPKLLVQLTDKEIFLELPDPLRTLDKQLQKLQGGIVAGLSALMPTMNEVLKRGAKDDPLDKMSVGLVEGIHALTMSYNSITFQRTKMHKPFQKPEFLRAMKKMKDSDMDPKYMYGGVVQEAVNSYEKTRKASKGAMKETQGDAKKAQSSHKKNKFGSKKPQVKPPSQSNFGGFHYPQQGHPPNFGFNPNFNQNFNPNNFNPNFRPRNPNHRPRHPNPPAAAANGNSGQGFQKKGNK